MCLLRFVDEMAGVDDRVIRLVSIISRYSLKFSDRIPS